MEIQENISLKQFNTFGIDVKTKFYSTFSSLEELKQLIIYATENNLQLLPIGGGSNILFTQDFEGLVIKNNILGIDTLENNEEYVILQVGAGEIWHDLVIYAVNHDWGGLENLSLIPGSVGASPMQNIGAYGVEIKDVFFELQALNINTLKIETFDTQQCQFGYRESIFKKELKNKYIIISVCFKLQKNPILNTSYGAIKETLESMGITNPSIKDVSKAVCAIRSSKLPNPKEIGNAGSFFKNPEISTEHFSNLQKSYPALPHYPVSQFKVKIPAAWLIEQDGWKGKRLGNYGVHSKQALVLVNYGNARGLDIKQLSEEIKKSVYTKFGILLETEVNII